MYNNIWLHISFVICSIQKLMSTSMQTTPLVYVSLEAHLFLLQPLKEAKYLVFQIEI